MRPKARARFAGVVTSVTYACVTPSPPPPSPSIARDTNTVHSAVPAASSEKPSRPATCAAINTPLRPMRSLKRPQNGEERSEQTATVE